jgi:3-mercaptopyruvate sulfurtransferase SseA
LNVLTGYANADLLVSSQQVADQISKTTVSLIDVRSPEYYAWGHLPEAVNLPIAVLTQNSDGISGRLVPVVTFEQGLGNRGIHQQIRVAR